SACLQPIILRGESPAELVGATAEPQRHPSVIDQHVDLAAKCFDRLGDEHWFMSVCHGSLLVHSMAAPCCTVGDSGGRRGSMAQGRFASRVVSVAAMGR